MNICSFCFGRQASSAWLCSTKTVAAFSKFDYGFKNPQLFKSSKHLWFYNNYKLHSYIFKIRILWTKGIHMTFRFGIFFWKKLTVWLPVMVMCDLVYNIICVVYKSLIVIHALKFHVFWEGHKNMTKSPNLFWLTLLKNFK